MAEYIKRSDALAYLDEGSYWEMEDFEEACTLIKRVPTADVVEVVRCKDCRHFDEWADGGKTYSGCALDDWNHRAQNDYCSFGERMGDND